MERHGSRSADRARSARADGAAHPGRSARQGRRLAGLSRAIRTCGSDAGGAQEVDGGGGDTGKPGDTVRRSGGAIGRDTTAPSNWGCCIAPYITLKVSYTEIWLRPCNTGQPWAIETAASGQSAAIMEYPLAG